MTDWESWPFKLIYAPLVPVWIFYMIRSRSCWFFTSSNPKITFGGMEGEPKREMYDLLPSSLYPTTINIMPGTSLEVAIQAIEQAGIHFPFIVKPDVGGQGILFRKIDQLQQFAAYHAAVPVEYIVQEMVRYPLEVSVFHIRHPQSKNGKITGFLHKIPLQLIGDGQHTLEQLISIHPKASKRKKELCKQHQENWNQVVLLNEVYFLSYAANHNRGAHFIDLREHIDDKLLSVFDQLSLQIDDFYYGRYDIMCNSIEDLKQGKNFFILEYNGCGAEPNHIYDTGYSLWKAYQEILFHWRELYKISRYNRKIGVKPWSFLKGYRFLKNTNQLFAVMRTVEKSLP